MASDEEKEPPAAAAPADDDDDDDGPPARAPADDDDDDDEAGPSTKGKSSSKKSSKKRRKEEEAVEEEEDDDEDEDGDGDDDDEVSTRFPTGRARRARLFRVDRATAPSPLPRTLLLRGLVVLGPARAGRYRGHAVLARGGSVSSARALVPARWRGRLSLAARRRRRRGVSDRSWSIARRCSRPPPYFPTPPLTNT
jgi:hypothetical protein